MPDFCFVSGCKSHKKCSRFQFPKDEAMINKWSEAIGKSLEGKKINSLRVCELHFNEQEIQRETLVETESGEVLTFPTKIPRLVKGAIPSIFRDNPLYHAKLKKFEISDGESNYDLTRKEIIIIDNSVEDSPQEDNKDGFGPLVTFKSKPRVKGGDHIRSFSDLITKSSSIDHGEDWIVSCEDTQLHYFYVGSVVPVPKLSVHISGTLAIRIVFENWEMKSLNSLSSVVPVRVTNVKQIRRVLKICGEYVSKACQKPNNSNSIKNGLVELLAAKD